METILVGLLKLPFIGVWLNAFFEWQYRLVAAAMRRARRFAVRPREWSNQELSKIGSQFDGAVINVSGWRDEDQRGGKYRDYFPKAESYTISNFKGARGLADEDGCGISIDLESDLPEDQRGRYQVAYNHTTLEHVFDIRKAISNICDLSTDAVILVTPFLQSVHYEEGSFGDFWRPTPMCLNRILADNDFTTVYQVANDTPWHYVYVFTVAVRNPQQSRIKVGPLNIPLVGVGHFSV